jgi:hypothetical protein
VATYLTTAEVSKVIRLLTLLRSELQLSIDCHTPPSDSDDVRMVKLWTREQAVAEELAERLDRRQCKTAV